MTLGPKPTQFEAVKMVGIEDDNEIIKSVPDKPIKMRAHCWSNLKQKNKKI